METHLISIQGAMNGGDNLGLKERPSTIVTSFGHTLPREIAFNEPKMLRVASGCLRRLPPGSTVMSFFASLASRTPHAAATVAPPRNAPI